jgi:hypothetical protein
MKRISWALLALVAGIGIAASAAEAQNATCSSMLAAGNYNAVIVPANASCLLLSGVTVTA